MTNSHIKNCCSKFEIFTVKQFREKYGFYACEKSIKKLSNNSKKQWKENYKQKSFQVKNGIIKSYKNGRAPYFKGKTKENCKALKVISQKNTGKVRTKEQREKYSESKKGNKNPAKRRDVRKKIRLGNIQRIKEGRYVPFTNTKPHRLLRESMKKNNLWNGFRDEVPMHYTCIDIADEKRKIAIFVDGDYWHGNPKKHKVFSEKQLKRKTLDKRHNTYLKNRNWIVLRFWEDDINNNIENCIQEIKKIIK